MTESLSAEAAVLHAVIMGDLSDAEARLKDFYIWELGDLKVSFYAVIDLINEEAHRRLNGGKREDYKR